MYAISSGLSTQALSGCPRLMDANADQVRSHQTVVGSCPCHTRESESLIPPTSLALLLGFGWLLRAGPRLAGLSVIGPPSVDGLAGRGESFSFFFCFWRHKVTEEDSNVHVKHEDVLHRSTHTHTQVE